LLVLKRGLNFKPLSLLISVNICDHKRQLICLEILSLVCAKFDDLYMALLFGLGYR